jgi:DNA-binding MarR family transcriptional regulator
VWKNRQRRPRAWPRRRTPLSCRRLRGDGDWRFPPSRRATAGLSDSLDERQQRRLGLTNSEVIAIQHLARAGELTPGQLGGLLQLSSGGTAGLVGRLQRAGHVSRHAHPHDRRSVVVRLTPAIAGWATDTWAPFVAQIDSLVEALAADDREVVRRFLDAAAQAAERHADRLARDADASAHDALAVALPALWA